MAYSLRRQPNGSFALFNDALGETMHPQLGPWLEATQLYVAGTRLPALLQAAPPQGRGGRGNRHPAGTPNKPPAELVLFDVGLGGAATALAALACREELVRGGARNVRALRIVSFEQDLEALRFALQNVDRLTYLRGHEAAAQALLDHGAWSDGAGAAWHLRLGDFTRLVDEEPLRTDSIFFDAFSPRGNPGPWSLPALESLYRCRRPGGLTRLATYSSAFGVRAALLLAGFYVGEGPRLAGRFTTVASTAYSDLAHPLDGAWLTRWRRDREPWPPLSDPAGHRALREALLAHPQWSQQSQGVEEPERAQRGRPQPARKAHPGPRSRKGRGQDGAR